VKIPSFRAALPVVAVCILGACSSETADADGEAPAITSQVPPVVGGATPLTPAQQQQQMEMFTELQAIDQQLSVVRDRALQMPDMKALEEGLIAVIEEAMEEVKPGTIALRAEFDGLIGQYTAAQESGDQEALAELTPQLQTMDTELKTVQATVMERPEMREAVEAFQESLFEYMREIDASADSLFNRGEQLNVELEALMAGAGD
jgi:glutamine synthetase type III